MSVLVVGGAGFIGSHLCEALLSAGEDVICLDDFSRGTMANLTGFKESDRFHIYEMDASDIESLATVFKENDITQVYHLAANSDIQASAKEPAVEYKNTYSTTFAILECMRKFGVKKLFFGA